MCHVILPRTPLVEVEGVEVVAKVVRCVEYFISYELYSIVIIDLTSLPVIDRFLFNNSLIFAIKNYTLDNLILGSITAGNANN